MGTADRDQIGRPSSMGQRQVEPGFRFCLLAQMLRDRAEFVGVDGHGQISVAEASNYFALAPKAVLGRFPVSGHALYHANLMQSDVFKRWVVLGGSLLTETGKYFPGLLKLLREGQGVSETKSGLLAVSSGQGRQGQNGSERLL